MPQAVATPSQCQLNVFLQTCPGPPDEKVVYGIERANSDFEIRQRIPKRIEEDFNGFFLPQSVTWIRLCGPWNQILTDKQAMERFVVPAKPDFRTPSRLPTGHVLQQRKSRAFGPDRIQSIERG